jgi:IclR family KDG regulon transcriptional repressor
MYSELGKKREFKRVPALDKCFRMLDLFASSERPLCVSEIARHLKYNKSTVYSLVHTLRDLEVLEQIPENRFRFDVKLYALGKSSGSGSELVSTVRPYLEEISRKTRLSAFLGIRSGDCAVILDKVDPAGEIRVSSEVGMRIPLQAGAGGKAHLSQLSDGELEQFLSERRLEKFTPASCIDPKKFKDMIKKARQEGFAVDDEEYVAGIRAFAVPLCLRGENLHAAIWVVGLKSQIRDDDLASFKSMLKQIAGKIETRFCMC